ncbi:bifunctional ADP-dependent NAD(P)H-hydrate dehydratase/NAD(P)H-hydrate epimerase [Rarobacter incanus]|uniref:Bifunctional NAD(P)H-hydrate repair enzyme n=1 Tax=Rarobacter incanus TaxID=153494 RepID=A0A542SR64_9MICO|nr:bifunctional ADP-dependent NAD(P)H-hydrate dehydratase/NAD(P)H-hydrate epimerase [Rarobacter incanus]TQK77095.1 hydroxyethylthiazole kinase-like uncharacterized protein yjeF/hydroxyethylthiazole kinase-like uncharacterized protein yjeF [Rarobacter incanus]
MIEGFSAEDVRAAEEPLLAAGVPLMERAAFGLAMRALAALRARGGVRGARVVVLAGRGNNGADAMLAGAHLAARGAAVSTILVAGSGVDHAVARLRSQGGRFLALQDADDPRAIEMCRTATLVLDGVLGTGSAANTGVRGNARTLMAQARGAIASAGAFVIAVDQPSGIDSTTGAVPDPQAVLPADETVTFGAAKAGLLCEPAATYAGTITVIDIGMGAQLTATAPVVRRLQVADVRAERLLRAPRASDHKYLRGVVGIIAGSAHYPGAAIMSCAAAQHAGVGMVRYFGPREAASQVIAANPQVVHAAGRVQAYVAGSGLPADHDSQAGADRELAAQYSASAAALALALGTASPVDLARLGLGEGAAPVPIVLDAGALTALPRNLPAHVVLTPHAGELASLLNQAGHPDVTRAGIEGAPLRFARMAHGIFGGTLLLKGSTTIIAGAGGVWSQNDGTAWLATAGAGDALAGIVGAVLAQNSSLIMTGRQDTGRIVALAAMIHGMSARFAAGLHPVADGQGGRIDPDPNLGRPITVPGLIECIPRAVAQLLSASPDNGGTIV